MSRTACTGTDRGARAHPGPRVGACRQEPAAAAPHAGTGSRPGLLLAVWILAVAFGAVAEAHAARLTDLRVGVHDDYTRVVLETDASVEPDVRQTDEEIVLLLDAQSEARHVPAPKSPHLESVRVTPSAGTAGSEVRIRLRRPVALERFSLDGPPRLVLDLSPGAPQTAAATEDEGAAEGAEAEATRAGEAADSGEDAADLADTGTAESERWSEGTEGSALVREDPEASEERELLEGGRMAATSPEAGDEGTGDPAEQAGAPSDSRVAEPGDAAPPRAAVPPPDARGGPLDFLPPPLNQPTTLAILAAILIGLFVLTRLRSRRAADDRLSPFDAAEDEPEATASGTSGAPPHPHAPGETGAEHASAGEEPSDDDDELPAPRVRTTGSAAPAGASAQPSMFDAPGGGAADEAAGDLETPAGPAPEDAGAVGAPASSGAFDPPAAGSFDPGAAGAAGAAAASAAAIPGEEPAGPPGSGAELERRLGHLERQVEELLDEKERLERQVAAQTEELRVQRAAIARTQRVLRGMSRPDDEASEPVPR